MIAGGAEVQREDALAGDDVLRAGSHRDLPHRPNRVRPAASDPFDREHHLRSGSERIGPRSHHGRSGMIGPAADGDPRVIDADDVAYHGERDPRSLQSRALFDVELEICSELLRVTTGSCWIS